MTDRSNLVQIASEKVNYPLPIASHTMFVNWDGSVNTAAVAYVCASVGETLRDGVRTMLTHVPLMRRTAHMNRSLAMLGQTGCNQATTDTNSIYNCARTWDEGRRDCSHRVG